METVKEQNLDKQQIGNHIGCMAGFFNIFDRPHLLSPKRFALPKRLSSSSSSPNVESETASEKSSPLIISKDLGIQKQQSISIYSTPELRSPAPESLTAPIENLTRSPLTRPIIEFKEGSSSRSPWRFSKEAPRLSLDSRAVVDAKGSLKPRQIRAESGISRRDNNSTEEGENQRGSPSVIARLMGLEALPSAADSPQQQSQKSGLQRSASESRVSREYRFVDSFNFQSQQHSPNPPCCSVSGNYQLRDENGSIGGEEDPAELHVRSARAQPARAPPAAQQRYPVRRKSFFDSTDFFPEPRQYGLIHGDVEKVTKMSGFNAQPNDLETLKQLLEALKLKGLLHSSNKQQFGKIGSRNLVFDNHESPIKPARSPGYLRQSRDSSSPFGIRSGASTRVVGAGVSPSASPRRDRSSSYGREQIKGRNRISPNRSVKSPNWRPTLKETPEQQRRVSPLPWRRPEPVETRNRGRPIEDESSQVEEEMWKMDNKQGKTLLERCDKLLQSIAEMAAAEASAGESQPSPVSVLDASLYHEESSPPPVMKRSLDFAATLMTESEDESWGGSMVSISSSSDSSEYVYVADILRASDCLPQDSDVFSLLEKQQYLKGKCGSRAAAQERRLIFDAVQEIVGRRRRLPPWRRVGEGDDKMQVIWSEFQKIRKKGSSREEEENDDLVGYVCGVLGRDLSEDGWRDCQVEMSEAVLDIERLIFKDLIGETINHMAALNRFGSLRRRLVF